MSRQAGSSDDSVDVTFDVRPPLRTLQEFWPPRGERCESAQNRAVAKNAIGTAGKVMRSRYPAAPTDLGRPGQAFWRRIVRQFEFRAEHELVILRLACRQLDIAEQARAEASKEPFVQGRFGLKPHPGLVVERNATIAFSRLIRQLGLSDELEDALTTAGSLKVVG